MNLFSLAKGRNSRPEAATPAPLLESRGVCPVCSQLTTFRAHDAWLRDAFVCTNCDSVPRERALFRVLELVCPGWRGLRVHESSPTPRSLTKFLRECAQYTRSEYDPSIPFGTMSPDGAYRSEDLEAQTFADASFDLVVTQDVFEHMFDPARAVAEIARTLTPTGLHVFTVPIANGPSASQRRASRDADGTVTHLFEPLHHLNPISEEGSLVTIDWGYDIAAYLDQHGSMTTTIFSIDDLSLGIRGALNEVLVSRKQTAPEI